MSSTRLNSLPNRDLVPFNSEANYDDHGFVIPSPSALKPNELFTINVSLISAPAWTGKTYVADLLIDHLSRETKNRGPFGSRIQRTNFARNQPLYIKPEWWQRWKSSSKRACWIIDSVDEDERRGRNGQKVLYDLLESLNNTQRARLCLIIFVRENELSAAFLEDLTKLFGKPSEDGVGDFRRLTLTLLSEEEARNVVENAAAMDRVKQLILANDLKSVAALPSILRQLERYPPTAKVTDVEVWKDVLRTLLEDKERDPSTTPNAIPYCEQFAAAARLAAILTFGDANTIDDGGRNGRPLGLDSLIRADTDSGSLRFRAAKEALRSTIFRKNGGTQSFARHHIQQWLAAFGVADLPLVRVRPLLTDNSGKLAKAHTGVLSLLIKTAKTEVRHWIIQMNGGVVPRSDAAPWSLADAITTLDQLQKINRATPWGIHAWNHQNLGQLKAPGLEQELCKRLASRKLSDQERKLVIDVAVAVGAKETISNAVRIVKDATESNELREWAVLLPFRLNDLGAIKELAQVAETLDHKSAFNASLKATIVGRVFDEGIWDFKKTYSEAPPPSRRTDVLYYTLTNRMQLEDARYVIDTLNVKAFLAELAERSKSRRLETDYKASIVEKALQLLTAQKPLSDLDLERLMPLTLALTHERGHHFEGSHIAPLFAVSESARRELLRLAAQREENEATGNYWHIYGAITPADTQFLLNLVNEYGVQRKWLSDLLIHLVRHPSISRKLRTTARAAVESFFPGHPKSLDQGYRKYRQMEQRSKLEMERRKQKALQQVHELKDILRRTLAQKGLSTKQKAMQAAWMCFVDKSRRPTNVTGDFDGISAELRRRVLNLAEKSLQFTKPTERPSGNSWSIWISYEAALFRWVVENPDRKLKIDDSLIRKWLPSCAVVLHETPGGFLQRLHSVSPIATEQVLVDELERRLSSNPTGTYLIDEIPEALWTDSFALSVRDLVVNRSYVAEGRMVLLASLVKHAAPLAVPVLDEWLSSADQKEQMAAIDQLLSLDPAKAWTALSREIRKRGKQALLEVHSLHDLHGGRTVNFADWPSDVLEGLARALLKLFPPHKDPIRHAGKAYSVGPQEEYRELRQRIPSLLLKRDSSEDKAALDRLAAEFKTVDEWLKQQRGNVAAANVLARLDGEQSNPLGLVPVEKVARLLEDDRFCVIRTPEDLQAVLVSELEEISKDAAHHLSMLYLPRKGKGKASLKSKSNQSLEEDALQAYIYCRLLDRVPGRVLEQLLLHREPLTTKDQRNDIKAQSTAVDGTTVTVIIELKWARNRKTCTGLTDQLAAEYLRGSHLTHGIYLVGWSIPGPWKKGVLPKPKDRADKDEWRKCLTHQATLLKRCKKPIHIEVVMLDLSWPATK